jgi:hypothetical protein
MYVRFSTKIPYFVLFQQKTWLPWAIFFIDWLKFEKMFSSKTADPNNLLHSTNDVCKILYTNYLCNFVLVIKPGGATI